MGLWYLLDVVMGGMWVTVYALVIVSSLEYKCPRISPLFPVLVLPWELTAVLYDFTQKQPMGWTQISRIGFCTGNMIIGTIILRWFMQSKNLVHYAAAYPHDTLCGYCEQSWSEETFYGE